MPSHVVHRPATEVELAFLQKTLASAATTARRWKQGIENALVLWAVTLLGLVGIWLVCAWLGRKLFEIEFGSRSSAAIWVVGAATLLSASYAVASTVRRIKRWVNYRPLLVADISGAQVAEERYLFKAAKRFQEPEHGGLIYFLRTQEDRVLTLCDHESQDLGVQGGDPLKSSFIPKSELVMIRAPKTALIIDKAFSGKVLDAGDPIILVVPPNEWPQTESYCDIPWTELEARLGPVAPAQAT